MSELVRCKPCGYVMPKDKLNKVCPACGMSAKVFEPYRERVAANRLFILNLDLHPIAIHISQTFIGLIPILLVLHHFYSDFYSYMIPVVLEFTVNLFPYSLVLALGSGFIDGLMRFKSLRPPLLYKKLILSILILIASIVLKYFTPFMEQFGIAFVVSSVALAMAVALGLIGKKLLNVILPGSYPVKKRKSKNIELKRK